MPRDVCACLPAPRSFYFSGDLSSTTFSGGVTPVGSTTCNPDAPETGGVTFTDNEWHDQLTGALSEATTDAARAGIGGQLKYVDAKRSAARVVAAAIAIGVVMLLAAVASTARYLDNHAKGRTTRYPADKMRCCCCDCGTRKLGDPCTAVGVLAAAFVGA